MSLKRQILFNVNSTGKALKDKNFIFALAHTVLIFKTGAIYTYIPKNACTLFRYNIGKANGFINENNKDFIHYNNQLYVPTLSQIYSSKFLFIILRNPFERLVSCYLDNIVKRIDFFGKRFIDIFGRDSSFDKFVNKIYDENLITFNEHWAPQNSFFIVKSYDFYLNLKNLSIKLKYLEKKTGIKFNNTFNLFDNHNQDIKKIESKLNCYELTPTEIKDTFYKNRCIPKYKYFYNKNLFNKVNELYQKDIEIYREKFNIKALDEIKSSE